MKFTKGLTMSDDPIPTDEEFEELLGIAKAGVRSYPDVIPALIREVLRLRRALRAEQMWRATRDVGRGW